MSRWHGSNNYGGKGGKQHRNNSWDNSWGSGSSHSWGGNQQPRRPNPYQVHDPVQNINDGLQELKQFKERMELANKLGGITPTPDSMLASLPASSALTATPAAMPTPATSTPTSIVQTLGTVKECVLAGIAIKEAVTTFMAPQQAAPVPVAVAVAVTIGE